MTATVYYREGCAEGCLNLVIGIASLGLYDPGAQARGDRAKVVATEFTEFGEEEVLLDVTATDRRMRDALEAWAENVMGGKTG